MKPAVLILTLLLGISGIVYYVLSGQPSSRPVVHGHYWMKNGQYAVFMYDFYDINTVFVYAVRNDSLFLGKGHWKKDWTRNLKIENDGIEHSQNLLDKANFYLYQLTNKRYDTFTEIKITDVVDPSRDTLLVSKETDLHYTKLPRSYYEKLGSQ